MSDICVSIIKAHFDFTYSETGHSTESLIYLRRFRYFKRQSRFKDKLSSCQEAGLL